jgi:hypothetical protein
MLFKLTNKKMNRETHCGVLEFVADEGRIYIPYWVNIARSNNHYLHVCFKKSNYYLIFQGFIIVTDVEFSLGEWL